MISPNESGRGMAAAKKSAAPGVRIDDLDAKWSATSPQVPLCASCNVKIHGDDENDMPNIPIRLWKKIGGVTLELCLCPKCWEARIIR